MDFKTIKEKANGYFTNKLEEYKVGPRVADCNSIEAQEIRFEQICKILPKKTGEPFSICDYGCGLGDLKAYLEKRYSAFTYIGVDLSEPIIKKAIELHGDSFVSGSDIPGEYDYILSSGIFNNVLDNDKDEWFEYILETLKIFNEHALKGFSFNCLTKYSDADRMRDDLFYADPCFIFDYCKRNFSRNVALLHDYEIYDFTILVRK